MKKNRKEKDSGGAYFKDSSKVVEFFSSGCTVLDCVLGGGWAEKRVINIVGDSAAGKTLLAEEACINFFIKYKDACEIYYHETESAFDDDYAKSIGLPIELINFVVDDEGAPIITVEGFYDKVRGLIEHSIETGKHILYVVDSLDALTGLVEVEESLGKADYGAKAKNLSTMFRRISAKMEHANFTLVVVSQTRKNIGGFRTWRVSGGEALKFYSSQRIILTEKSKLYKTVRKVKRAVGVLINAYCFKNKVGLPFRDCAFEVKFYFGVDDIGASVDWLYGLTNKGDIFKDLNLDAFNDKNEVSVRKLGNLVEKIYQDDPDDIKTKIKEATIKHWKEIDDSFLPKSKKYSIIINK